MDDLHVRRASENDLEAINRIYNREIETGVATWDLDPWPLERRQQWFAAPADQLHVVVAESEGAVIGFAYLSLYRERAGYRFTREDTVYVDPAYHRRGAGRALLAAVIEQAQQQHVHCLIARIEASNTASLALHRAFGFIIAGHEREIGHKFGRWLDLMTMQLLLESR